jgi:hypothetical protein
MKILLFIFLFISFASYSVDKTCSEHLHSILNINSPILPGSIGELTPATLYQLPKHNGNQNDYIHLISFPKNVLKELKFSDQKAKKFFSAIQRGMVTSEHHENGIKKLKGADGAYEVKHTFEDGIFEVKGISDHKTLSKAIHCP